MALQVISVVPEESGLVVTVGGDTFPEINDVSGCRRLAEEIASQHFKPAIIVSQETQTLNAAGEVLPRQISLEDLRGGLTFRKVFKFISGAGQFAR